MQDCFHLVLQLLGQRWRCCSIWGRGVVGCVVRPRQQLVMGKELSASVAPSQVGSAFFDFSTFHY